jgi:hypothetical protein
LPGPSLAAGLGGALVEPEGVKEQAFIIRRHFAPLGAGPVRIVNNDPDICLITRERWGPAFGGGLTGSGTITTLIDEFVRGELWTLVEPLLPRVGTRCSPSRTYAEQVHRLKRTQLVNK